MLDPDIRAYYDLGLERDRLSRGGAPSIERARTQDILARHLPVAPSRIIDVGGASGVYAGWLAERGHDVHLVDPVPMHIEQAGALSETSGAPFTVALGDARFLDEPDQSADAVMLLGPLYHLVERSDRVRALAEGCRVVKRGGVVVAAGISRFASLLDGFVEGVLDDPTFAEIVERDLASGVHTNPTARPEWFTTAYFHRPNDLADEAADAGLVRQVVLGVEGPGWWLESSKEESGGDDHALRVARILESEPSIVGASAHLMLVARRPA